jgi:hypothetical protein
MRDASAIKAAVVHYVGGDGTQGYGAVSPQQTAAYQTGPDSHEQFPAIAYHVYIARDGTLYQCHELERRTWHAGATRTTRASRSAWPVMATQAIPARRRSWRRLAWCAILSAG